MSFARLIGLPDLDDLSYNSFNAPLVRLWDLGRDDPEKVVSEAPLSQLSRPAWEFGRRPPSVIANNLGILRVYPCGWSDYQDFDDDSCPSNCAFCAEEAYWAAISRVGLSWVPDLADDDDSQRETLEVLEDPRILADVRESEDDLSAGRVYEWDAIRRRT